MPFKQALDQLNWIPSTHILFYFRNIFDSYFACDFCSNPLFGLCMKPDHVNLILFVLAPSRLSFTYQMHLLSLEQHEVSTAAWRSFLQPRPRLGFVNFYFT